MKSLKFLLILAAIIIQSCASNQISGVKNGDLIFVSANKENLSGAISRVTRKKEKISFDHVGIISETNKKFFVYHAAPKGGSQKQSLEEFLLNVKKEKSEAAIYRLKPNYQEAIPNAVLEADKMIGKPYNFTYILNENRFYCSDFVERAFRQNHIFSLIPMNFKNPETGKIDDYWYKFYANLSLEVPQDKPGTNPNQLSESDKLYFVKTIK